MTGPRVSRLTRSPTLTRMTAAEFQESKCKCSRPLEAQAQTWCLVASVQSLGQSKPTGQPRFQGQRREPPGTLFLGEGQCRIAKRVDTLKGGDLGTFCNLSSVSQCADELPRSKRVPCRCVDDGAHAPTFSYFVSRWLNFGVKLVRRGMWNRGREGTGLYLSSLLM